MMEEFERSCCTQCYQIYEDIWEAAVGEMLACLKEPDSDFDRYAVAVKREGVVIGQLSCKLSLACSLFLDVEGL